MKTKNSFITTGLIAFAALGLSLPAQSAVTIQSYWQLGEGAVGADSSSANDGETNNFNNSTGTTILTASPSGVAGSTAYAHTTGTNFQGLWMFGGGSNNQTVPADNWGVQFMVRSTNTASIGLGTWRGVFGMKDASTGGLVIEAKNVGGTVYWEVNRSGQENLIIPHDTLTTVTINEWTNLALVRSGGTTSFYVDGALAGTSTGSIGTTDGLLAFGFMQGVGTSNFQGDFDEASLFTFAPGEFATSDLLVPEPSTALLGGLGMLALLRRRKC